MQQLACVLKELPNDDMMEATAHDVVRRLARMWPLSGVLKRDVAARHAVSVLLERKFGVLREERKPRRNPVDWVYSDTADPLDDSVLIQWWRQQEVDSGSCYAVLRVLRDV